MRPYLLISVFAATGFVGVVKPSPHDEKREGVTLLGTLSEWRYPEAKMLDGATMQDGGNPALPSIFCHSVLTTPDSVDKVVAFYTGTVKESEAKTKPASGKPIKAMEGGCVLVQDDAKNRPVAVKVIVVTKPNSTTTLVVSRGAGESETHIAWTHHIRHDVRR